MVVGSALLSTLTHGEHIPGALYGFEVVFGFGIGASLVAALLVVKLNASPEDSAAAQGLLSETRILGGNVGLAVSTIILNARLSHDLKDVLSPQQLLAIQNSLNSIALLDPVQQAAVQRTFARAFQTQFWVCIGIGALAALTGVFLWQRHPPTFASVEQKKKETQTLPESDGSLGVPSTPDIPVEC